MLTSQPQPNIWVTTLHYLGAPPSTTTTPLPPILWPLIAVSQVLRIYIMIYVQYLATHMQWVLFLNFLCYVTNIFLPTLPLIHNSLRGCRLCEVYVTIHIYALCYNVCVYVCVWVRVGVTDLVL